MSHTTLPGTTPGESRPLSAHVAATLGERDGVSRWGISWYASARDNRPRRIEAEWSRLVARLTTHQIREGVADKRDLPAWSPAVLAPGARRANDAVEAVSCIVLDYDDGTELATAREPWMDWPHIWHTSWSHTEELAKFRLVIPLARAVPVVAWRWVWAWAARRAAGGIDQACKDASRLYFLPAVKSANAPRWAGVHDPGGWCCDPDWDRATVEELQNAGKAMHAVQARALYREAAPRVVASGGAMDAIRAALRVDPDARRRAGEHLGGRLTSSRVSGVVCPRCGDRSVWWLLEPDARRQAACNHRNSCGWHGWIDELVGGGE